MSDRDANKKVGNEVSARTVLLVTMVTAGVIAVNLVTAIVLSTIAFHRTSHCSAVSNYSTMPTNTVRNGDYFQLASGTISSVEAVHVSCYYNLKANSASNPFETVPATVQTAIEEDETVQVFQCHCTGLINQSQTTTNHYRYQFTCTIMGRKCFK